MQTKEWVTKKTWSDFRKTGLLLFINSILHVFGWAFVVEVDQQTGEVTAAWPARVRFRGFDEKSTEESHIQIADYLADNIDELKKEANDTGN